MFRFARILFAILIVLATNNLIYSQWKYYDSPESGEIIDLVSDGNQVYVLATGGLFFIQNEDSLVEIPMPNGSFIPKRIFAGGGHLYLYANKEPYYHNPLLFHSYNGGQSWHDVAPSVNINGDFTMIFKGDTILIPFFYSSRCMVSEDAGNNFYGISGPFTADGFFIDSTVYTHGLASSPDLGQTWDWHYQTPGTDVFSWRISNSDGKIWLMIKNEPFDTIHFVLLRI